MGTRYEPGTVAVATVRGVEGVRVMRAYYWQTPGWVTFTEPTEDHRGPWLSELDVTDVRPLVVLDPEDSAQVTRLLDAYVRPFDNFVTPQRIAIMQDALRAQTRPPKPPEPTGLGAVVRDRKGRLFVVDGMDVPARWRYVEAGWREVWDAIDAVEVLSPGVSP